jgi:hypothetical protein
VLPRPKMRAVWMAVAAIKSLTRLRCQRPDLRTTITDVFNNSCGGLKKISRVRWGKGKAVALPRYSFLLFPAQTYGFPRLHSLSGSGLSALQRIAWRVVLAAGELPVGGRSFVTALAQVRWRSASP